MNAEQIQSIVAEYYKIGMNELLSNCRNRCYARPRQISMFLIRELTSLSFPDIGLCFGGKNHATVIHACKKVAKLADENERIRADLAALRMKLKGETSLSVSYIRFAAAAAVDEPELLPPFNYRI